MSSPKYAGPEDMGEDLPISLADIAKVTKSSLVARWQIHSQRLMALDIVGLSWCTRLFSLVCRSVTVPLFPMIKKGDQRVHSDYLGIPLLVSPW